MAKKRTKKVEEKTVAPKKSVEEVKSVDPIEAGKGLVEDPILSVDTANDAVSDAVNDTVKEEAPVTDGPLEVVTDDSVGEAKEVPEPVVEEKVETPVVEEPPVTTEAPVKGEKSDKGENSGKSSGAKILKEFLDKRPFAQFIRKSDLVRLLKTMD